MFRRMFSMAFRRLLKYLPYVGSNSYFEKGKEKPCTGF
jgi:hypothetical protein